MAEQQVNTQVAGDPEFSAAAPPHPGAAGTVVEVYQSGYRINGSVLRPARVVVAA